MTARVDADEQRKHSMSSSIDLACSRIAPSWPLDRLIAVNPYWGWRSKKFDEVARVLPSLAGGQMYMASSYYKEAQRSGAISPRHIELAKTQSPRAEESRGPKIFPLLSSTLDGRRDLSREPRWSTTITHQISQYCASYFDKDQADWMRPSKAGLYCNWHQDIFHERGIDILMSSRIHEKAKILPSDAVGCIATAMSLLAIPEEMEAAFFTSLLLSINGWASWCSFLRWEARLSGKTDNHIVELLAIRVAWELLLDNGDRGRDSVWEEWQRSLKSWRNHTPAMPAEAVLHSALELSYQESLAHSLCKPKVEQLEVPKAQAVFCIDVRSEVLRRALEGVSSEIETLGFAGFFGLPISFNPLGTELSIPHLPGLLAPALAVSESYGSEERDRDATTKRGEISKRYQSWQLFKRLPASAFTLVEATGLSYLYSLTKKTLIKGELDRKEERFSSVQFLGNFSLEERILVAERILRAMSFTKRFAPIVLFVGHGAECVNNPHAAGLQCGACGGNAGGTNARALALLLNTEEVREGLKEKGISIPKGTVFLPALHNTTTDEVELLDRSQLAPEHAEILGWLREKLGRAGHRARAERAPSVGFEELVDEPGALLKAFQRRAADWSQPRPEWGLANNASFVAAPRSRTRGANLQGRTFLHEYLWEDDKEGKVLELILTAPVVVANWINLQYFASTVDNDRYGSGNKLLHNVVGGTIGVFEGNGGDLRIGLSRQSLHDGTIWRHTPLRLSVLVEAPKSSIESVIEKHEVVRELVDNSWLFLFQIDPETDEISRYERGVWTRIANYNLEVH